MQTYIVIYESVSNSDGYEKLIKANYPTYSQITTNSWVVVTNSTAAQIRDALLSIRQNNSDRIFVVRSGAVGAWVNTRGTGDWLKKYL